MDVIMNYSVLKYIIFFVFLHSSLLLKAQVGPEMIVVEGGTFQMGDNQYVGFTDEFPLHAVTVDGFEMSKTEITVSQWRAYCEANQLSMPDVPKWGWHDDHPVVNILWNEAMAYCQWLSSVNKGWEYRLPTEAEWEYAAKGGNHGHGYKYSGSQWIDTVGWYFRNAKGATHPVAQKLPNELGLYDMTGNAWEWCSDFEGLKYTSNKQMNPQGPTEGERRVVKGGAFQYNNNICRSSYRSGLELKSRRVQAGLRVVRTKSAQ